MVCTSLHASTIPSRQRRRTYHGDALRIVEPREGETLMQDKVDFVLAFDDAHVAYPFTTLLPPLASFLLTC